MLEPETAEPAVNPEPDEPEPISDSEKSNRNRIPIFWDPLGPPCDPWDPLGPLGIPWDPLGPLGTPWDLLGPLGDPMGTLWGPLGTPTSWGSPYSVSVW